MSVFYHQPLTPIPRWLKFLAFKMLNRMTLNNFVMNDFDDYNRVKADWSAQKEDVKTAGEVKETENSENVRNELSKDIQDYIRNIKVEKDKDSVLDRNRLEWQTVARITKRFFFIVTLSLVIIAMLSVFLSIRLH